MKNLLLTIFMFTGLISCKQSEFAVMEDAMIDFIDSNSCYSEDWTKVQSKIKLLSQDAFPFESYPSIAIKYANETTPVHSSMELFHIFGKSVAKNCQQVLNKCLKEKEVYSLLVILEGNNTIKIPGHSAVKLMSTYLLDSGVQLADNIVDNAGIKIYSKIYSTHGDDDFETYVSLYLDVDVRKLNQFVDCLQKNTSSRPVPKVELRDRVIPFGPK